MGVPFLMSRPSPSPGTKATQASPSPSKVPPSPKPTEDRKCRDPFPDRFLILGGTLVLSEPNQSVALFHVKGGPGVAVRAGETVGRNKYEVLSIGRGMACVRAVAGGA